MYKYNAIKQIRQAFHDFWGSQLYTPRRMLTTYGIINALVWKYQQIYLGDVSGNLPTQKMLRSNKPVQFCVTGLVTYLKRYWSQNEEKQRLKWLAFYSSNLEYQGAIARREDWVELSKLTVNFSEYEIKKLVDLTHQKALAQGASIIPLEYWLDSLKQGKFKGKAKNAILVSRTSIYECLRDLEASGAIRCHWRKPEDAKDFQAMVIDIKIGRLLICAEQIEQRLIIEYDFTLDKNWNHLNPDPESRRYRFPSHRALTVVNLFMKIFGVPWRRENPTLRYFSFFEKMSQWWEFPLTLQGIRPVTPGLADP